MLFERDAEPLSLDQRVTNVRTFGELAVVIGSYDEQLRVNGKPVRQTGMYTLYRPYRARQLALCQCAAGTRRGICTGESARYGEAQPCRAQYYRHRSECTVKAKSIREKRR